jgi:hypothetical protein
VAIHPTHQTGHRRRMTLQNLRSGHQPIENAQVTQNLIAVRVLANSKIITITEPCKQIAKRKEGRVYRVLTSCAGRPAKSPEKDGFGMRSASTPPSTEPVRNAPREAAFEREMVARKDGALPNHPNQHASFSVLVRLAAGYCPQPDRTNPAQWTAW